MNVTSGLIVIDLKLQQLRSLGKTDIKITPIGLGVMQFSGAGRIFKFMFPPMSREQSNAIVKTALDTGINWFDTAEAYGFGKSERKLSAGLQAAKAHDEEVIIATKWLPIMRWAGSITKTISKRLENLYPYTIDLHQIHQPHSLSSLEAQLNAMASLVENGKIRSIGVSNFSAEQMRKSHAFLEQKGLPLASNQVNYSLLNRKIERTRVLDTAKELGITIISWGPLQSGLLTGKYHKHPELLKNVPWVRRRIIKSKLDESQGLITELDNIAKEHETTISQIALSWLVNYHGETVVAIPGASSASQVKTNGETTSLNLSQSDLDAIANMSEQFI
jgi:aryl-alcohol dehydrogenase-like predicted oxidoreductase